MKGFVVEHHIQREILRQLSLVASLRFSQLKPDGMESNIFMYHLNKLIKGKYAQKHDGKYSLAIQGLRYTDNIISSTNFAPALHPKPLVVILLTNSKGELLLVRRHTQPYIDTCMFISGKQHFGEDSLAHAHRELFDKANLEGIKLYRRGLVDYRIRDADGEVITHIIGHVHSGEYNGPAPTSWTDRYSFEWHKPEDLPKLATLPGTVELYEVLVKHPNSQFFVSDDFVAVT
jgi:ADP-ribose pyrophosphatase YjhB (NUDIX family)